MAAKLSLIPILSILLILSTFTLTPSAETHPHGTLQLMNQTQEWQFQTHFHLQPETTEDEDGDQEAQEDQENGSTRRSLLYWRSPAPKRYYISYGALSANRVPCPPRSGRSYYTHNCHRARGPVHPYTRGCSAITRCRR